MPSPTRSNPPNRHSLLALLCVVLLGGCATQRGIALPEMPDWNARWDALKSIQDWSFTGRIGVANGEEGFNGRLNWRQSGDQFDASLSGPFGAGRVNLYGTPVQITVSDGDGIRDVLFDPEYDLRKRYGWTIPIESLRYWALGVPDPDLPAGINFSDAGIVESMDQGGWRVEIPQYRDSGGQPMPRRIIATQGESRVRLIIDRWTFHEGPEVTF